MRSIIHLSDIHFGKIHRPTVQPLVRMVHELRPDLVVISGDLTQRALREQFKEAREFLMSLPGPQIVVPGNHDVPVWNPLVRLTRPLGRFRRYINPNLMPFYEDDEIAVIGINTARPTTTKYGHINRQQLSQIYEKLCPVSNDKIKIVVTHHPFDLPEGYRNTRQIVGKAQRAMRVLAECGADLFLAGHLHKVFTRHTTERYKFSEHAALIVQAGTATSSKSKFERNSFNFIETEHDTITVTRIDFDQEKLDFTRGKSERFHHTPSGWSSPVAEQI